MTSSLSPVGDAGKAAAARPSGAPHPASAERPRRFRLWRALLLTVVLVALVTGGAVVLGIERRMIYFPDRHVAATPQHAGLPYEDVSFPAGDGTRLHGWWVPAPGARITLLWCHGNAGNVGHRVENLALFHRRLGVNVFLFDYRGYGRSDGSFGDLSERATHDDAEGAWRWLSQRPDASATAIVYFGRSLGAAVATELARRHPPAGLVLETPFTSVRDMAKIALPFLPVGPFLRTRYDTLGAIADVDAPLLVLHGDRDRIVPLEQGRRVFEASPGRKTFFLIPGADHNDTYVVGGEAWIEAWRAFLAIIP